MVEEESVESCCKPIRRGNGALTSVNGLSSLTTVDNFHQHFPIRCIEKPEERGVGTGAGGYAREMSEAYKQAQYELTKKTAASVDIVITTALIPGRPALALAVFLW